MYTDVDYANVCVCVCVCAYYILISRLSRGLRCVRHVSNENGLLYIYFLFLHLALN